MTFVRNHLGLILPLFAILFALEYMLVLDRTIRIYQERLREQYSIIVVADKTVTPSRIRNANVLVGSVEKVDPQKVLLRLRRQISRENLQKLQEVLPVFYTVKLRDYPGRARLEALKNDLAALKGVRRVQVFEKVHDKLYGMLLFMKSNFYVFGGLLALIGFLLIMKQMMIWQLEHRERMQIMALFGAPVWLRSGVLFRLAFVDALLAVVLVTATMFYLMENPYVTALLAEMEIDSSQLLRPDDLIWIASAGFGIALFCAAWVVMRFREEL